MQGSHGQLGGHDRSARRPVADREPSLQRRDPVRETPQASARLRVGASTAVVLDLDPHGAREPPDADVDAGRLRVPDGVRDALGGDEVETRLDRLVEALVGRAVDADLQRGALDEGLQSGRETALGPDGGGRRPA